MFGICKLSSSYQLPSVAFVSDGRFLEGYEATNATLGFIQSNCRTDSTHGEPAWVERGDRPPKIFPWVLVILWLFVSGFAIVDKFLKEVPLFCAQ
jgi:hypothetical protein